METEEMILKKNKKREEELDKKFEKSSEQIQKDILFLQYKGDLAHKNMIEKMVFGKPIPDSLLVDIRVYYENQNTIFSLLEIDPKIWNE